MILKLDLGNEEIIIKSIINALDAENIDEIEKYLELIFYRRIPNELLDFYLENNFLSKLKIIFNKLNLSKSNVSHTYSIESGSKFFAYYYLKKLTGMGFIFFKSLISMNGHKIKEIKSLKLLKKSIGS